MRPLAPILERLTKAQSAFLSAADAVPSVQWHTRPETEAWSAAEVVAHLMMVERTIIAGADRITQKTPRPVPLLKRFHLPLWLVETRVVRRKTPIPLDPGLLAEKEEMLGDLRGVRERTLAFLDETKKRDLHEYRWPHPFLGMLNLYEWFEMVAAHQIRHAKQMKEIRASLPKVVGTSHS